MATWISHFRVADYFINKLKVEEKEFVVGNIGPDCGEPNEDWSKFTPSSNITHWTKDGYKNGIDSEGFFEKYLSDSTRLNKNQYSFYIGYYIHLLTDIEFSRNIAIPKREKHIEEFNKDKNFIWTMKKDWYDIDHLYLKQNPDFYAFKVFSSIEEFPNEYLEYYSRTAIMRQIKYITNFYRNFNGELEREYPYLTKEEMDNFIKDACKVIENKLIEKGILV